MTTRERAIKAFKGQKTSKKTYTSLKKFKEAFKFFNENFNIMTNFESLYYDLVKKYDSLEARHALLICEMQEYVKSKENK